MSHLTSEQVLALAPDAASAKAARGLATPGVWVTLGQHETALWGECKGSGKAPYRTQVDLSGPAFRCSCPSRKFPCKHGLGLLLLLATQPHLAAPSAPPPWVEEWLTSRAAAATRRETQAAKPAASGSAERNRAAREGRVAAGLAELQLWLEDRMRAGLGAFQAEAPAACATFAARMVDAQAPGVARLLRNLGTRAATGTGWQGRMLDLMARLHLLAKAYTILDSLPPEAQADVRTTLGFTLSQEEVLAHAVGLRDHWVVLGRQVEDEEHLRVQRTWLWGAQSHRPALLIEFSAGGQPLDQSLIAGSTLDAELVFYPSAAPLRALVRMRHATPTPTPMLPGMSLYAALGNYAAALAANPWLERYPLLVGPCQLGHADAAWHLHDAEGRTLPLPPRYTEGWALAAQTGGQPCTFAGVWNGEWLVPLRWSA
ncbi:MAG: SWIM zinc finger family protein [Candidatus Viridilinea halotolerans]|uniref:SWIM zinc finger family protein n=1 Tax=Candidatus Viridilinea halotolerans TaxID=2491704 RepID=A0A426U5K7_9CHLR|nr:MAG: SWIM zinc finger family protein [Candidatus Viridilinea halotolerans]